MQLPCRRLRRPRRVLRHGPAASCSAAMASRVSVSGMPGDASPDPATTSVATTVSASIKDSCCPVVPRERSEGFTRLPHCRVGCSMLPVNGRHILPDSPPPPFDRVACPCRRGASPHVIRDTCASRVVWHLGCGCRKLRLPRPCRIPAGCPVSRSVEVASDHTAIQRRQNGVSVPPAPRWHQNRMFSSLAAAALHADLAPRHYRTSATS